MSLKRREQAGPRVSAPEFLKQRVWLGPRARISEAPGHRGRWSRKPTASAAAETPRLEPPEPAEHTPVGPRSQDRRPGRAPRRSTEGILQEKRGLGPNSCCCRREAAQSRTLCDPTDGSPPGSPPLGFSRQEYRGGLPFPSPISD